MKFKTYTCGIALLATFAAIVGACSSNNINIGSTDAAAEGNIKTKTYNFTSDIKGIETSRGVIVHYTQESSTSVRAEGSAKMLEAAEITLSGGTLKATLKSNDNSRYTSAKDHLHVYVTAPSVNEFEASSGSSILSDGINIYSRVKAEASSGANIQFAALSAPNISLEASSGSSIKAENIKATRFEAETGSGASIRAAGEAESAELEANSGSSIDARALKASSGSAEAGSGASVLSSISNCRVEKSGGGSVVNR